MITYLSLSWYGSLPALYNGLAAGGGGIAFGLIATFIKTIGLFGISLIEGVFVGACILYIIHIFTVLTNVFIAPGIVLICFVIIAIPTLKWEKVVVILYTASYGTVLLMLSIDYYLNLSMLRRMAYENLISLDRVTKPCWFSWILFGLWPVMVILGCLVQLLKTGKYYDHKEGIELIYIMSITLFITCLLGEPVQHFNILFVVSLCSHVMINLLQNAGKNIVI